MRKIAILLAASTALVFGAAPAWQAYAQMERGPAALASAPKNFTPIVKAACGPYWGAHCGPGITGSAAGIAAGARPAEHEARRMSLPRLALTRRGGMALLAPRRRRGKIGGRAVAALAERGGRDQRSRLQARLVGDPPEALLAPEHRQHIEDARGSGAAGQRRPERLGDRAKLRALGLGVGAHDSLERRNRPL